MSEDTEQEQEQEQGQAPRQPDDSQSPELGSAGRPQGETREQPQGPAAYWFTHVNGQVRGPYRAEQVRQWLRQGRLSWDVQVSRGEGFPWQRARAVPELRTAPEGAPPYETEFPVIPTKSKLAAGLLAILLGSFGIHHFYLENWALGLLYLIFSCTGFPALLGLIEGILYLTAPDDRFERNYHNWFLTGA